MPPIPVDSTPHASAVPFELVSCLETHNKVPVFHYKSKDTNLEVIVADVEGPVVNGFFCLATETFDDDGLPHTLEHLIFLGSEQYPYKGVLDLLANRCFAVGTNAWTDTDHTCYTMETAGAEGFLSLLPIYLEHILYPVLSDEGFLTEVHHIAPDGGDAGVVYCEMQGRENTAESRLHLTMARAMYPGHCGYSSETGGLMKNLRESTTNAKVRAYHKQLYRPENLKIIITGQIKHKDIFKALEPLEQKIMLKGDRGAFSRPWQSPVPPLGESKNLQICYPASEEDNGIFCMGWRGPSAVTEQYMLNALSVFLKYLTEFPTYTLPQEFVEIDDPYASSISYNYLENSESCLYVMFEDVPLAKVSEIKPKLLKLLQDLVAEENINMDRIESIIKRHKFQHLSQMEKSPHMAITFMIIGQLLYGNSKEDFAQRLNPIGDLNKLLKEPKSFWVDLLRRYFVENSYVAVECRPSIEEFDRMAKEESERVDKQVEILGEDGLKEKIDLLDKAVAFNSRDPPNDMLTSVPIPSIDSISFLDIKQFRSDWGDRERIDLSRSQVYTCFDHIKTEFAYLKAFLDTSSLSPEQRVYLPLILESLFESPIRRIDDDTIIPYEEVIENLNKDTVSFNAGLGINGYLFECGAYSQTIIVRLQVETAKYQKGLHWLRDILYNIAFSAERFKIIAAKMNNAIAQSKRSGRDIAVYGMRALRFKESTNIHYNSIMVQNKFLTESQELLSDPERSADFVLKCDQIWKSVTASRNIVLYLSGNLDAIQNAADPLTDFLPSNVTPVQKNLHVTPEHELLRCPESQILTGCCIGVACTESAFFYQTLESIASHDHPDLPALMLYLHYLTQAEGPMWRQIRGKGYAYGYHMSARPNEGLLYFVLSKASNVVQAYWEAKQIVLNQLETREWDSTLLEAARSSLFFELVEVENTIGCMIDLAVKSYFKKVDFKHNRHTLTLVKDVTVDDLNRVGEIYLRGLFDPTRVKTSLVCNPTKCDEVVNAFKSENVDLIVFPSLEESFLKSECR